jgi:diguanylate cyclase (GGDEF)-like protein
MVVIGLRMALERNPPPGSSHGDARPTVLLVQAPSERASALRNTLDHEFHVFVAETVPAGIDILKKHSIAVILADQQMPDMGGLEFFKEAVRYSPRSKRVILAGNEIGVAVGAVNNGRVHGILRQSWDENELNAVMHHLMNVERLEAENARLVEVLRGKNDELLRKERLLAQSLDKRGQELLRSNAELEKANAELKRLTYRDGVTGLYNHGSFHERLREEIARARRYRKPLTLVMADIDAFKVFNEAHGHQCGDELLKAVATIMAGQTRASDVVTRYGGEEFGILLPETNKEGGRIKAERLRELINHASLPGTTDGERLSLSYGVAEYPTDADTAIDLVSSAQHALHIAKRLGRDRVQVYGEGQASLEGWDGPVGALTTSREPAVPEYAEQLGEIVQLLERQKMLDCLFIDLDRLRRVEQEYGSVTHGNLLTRAGDILHEMRGSRIREHDVLCRLADGDSFLIFLAPSRDDRVSQTLGPHKNGTGLALQELDQVAERISAWLDRALAPEVYDLLHDVARTAVGYARVLQNPMIKPERQVAKLVEEARESAGIMRKRRLSREKEYLQEIILGEGLRSYYQPIVNLDTGQIFGYEALTRGPRKTPLESPLALFSTAEDVDLLFELDRACFRGAIQRAQGLQPVHRLFVNILPPSFYDHTFIGAEVDKLLESLSIQPSNVVFEITERQAIENFANFRRALSVYTSAGFGVAIDDVGTKHSNLEAVIALRPDFVKLSDVMTRGIARSAIKREMIKSLLKFSLSIDAMIVAEGIETQSDMACLHDLGVRYGQGYFLARPGPPFPPLRGQALRKLKLGRKGKKPSS